MKFYLNVTLACLFIPSLVFAQVQFSTPIPVANGVTYGYLRPKITLDAENNPVVLWGKSSTHQIFVSTFNGATFNTPVQINPLGTHPFMASWYNADIKSQGDSMVVVFPTDMPANHVYLVKSTNGGNSWSDTVRVDSIPPDGIAYFPSVDINEWGEIAVAYMRHDAGWADPRYVVSTSHDFGNSFEPDVDASAVVTGEVCDCCPAHITYENDRQVLIFRNNDLNIREFYSSVSINNGTSYNGLNIDNQAWNVFSCPSVAPSAFISNDSLITVFMSGASGANRVYISTSTINSLQNGFVTMIDNVVPANTIQNHPKIAGKDSIMAMVWNNSIPGDADIYFRFSNTGAMGLLGDGIIISNPTTGAQQNPDIIYANGVFHIVYQNNPTAELYYLTATLDEYIGLETLSSNVKWWVHDKILFMDLTSQLNAYPLRIYNSTGSMVYSTTGSIGEPMQVDLGFLSSGMYWAVMNNQVLKFIL